MTNVPIGQQNWIICAKRPTTGVINETASLSMQNVSFVINTYGASMKACVFLFNITRHNFQSARKYTCLKCLSFPYKPICIEVLVLLIHFSVVNTLQMYSVSLDLIIIRFLIIRIQMPQNVSPHVISNPSTQNK